MHGFQEGFSAFKDAKHFVEETFTSETFLESLIKSRVGERSGVFRFLVPIDTVGMA